MRMEAYTLSGIGDLYADVDAFSSATHAYKQARIVAKKLCERFLLNYIDVAEAGVLRAEGKLESARILLQKVEEDAARADLDETTIRMSLGDEIDGAAP